MARNHVKLAKQQAIRWATQLTDRPFKILDYETNGDPMEPVQIAIIDHNGKKIMNELVCPENINALLENFTGKDKCAYDVHGIHPNDVQDKRHFPHFHNQWFDALADQTVVAYNAAFEKSVTDHICKLHQLLKPKIYWTCAMKSYAKYFGEWDDYHKSFQWQKLENACRSEDVLVSGNAHDALTDVRMTLGLIRAMAGVKHTIDVYTSTIREPDPDALNITLGNKNKNEIEQLFAPTKDMLDQFKSQTITSATWDRYRQQYYALMRDRYKKNTSQFVRLLKRDRIVLQCYCAQPHYCHRSLAVDILSKVAMRNRIAFNNLGELNVSEDQMSLL